MILFDLGIKLYKDKFRPQMDRHPRHCHSRSSTVDIILKVLSRKLSIVPLRMDSAWMGDRTGRIISTRARVDHVASDH